MSKKEIKNDNSIARDPDLANAEIALRQAAIKAREIASKNKSYVIYSIDGKIVKEAPKLEDNTN